MIILLLLVLLLPARAELIPLEVEVTQTIYPGPAPPPGEPQFTRKNLASTRVCVSAAGARSPVIAAGTTNKDGRVSFRLPPGNYWIYVPNSVKATVDLRRAGQPPVQLDQQLHLP